MQSLINGENQKREKCEGAERKDVELNWDFLGEKKTEYGGLFKLEILCQVKKKERESHLIDKLLRLKKGGIDDWDRTARLIRDGRGKDGGKCRDKMCVFLAWEPMQLEKGGGKRTRQIRKHRALEEATSTIDKR